MCVCCFNQFTESVIRPILSGVHSSGKLSIWCGLQSKQKPFLSAVMAGKDGELVIKCLEIEVHQ